jgi:hypothetical protein
VQQGCDQHQDVASTPSCLFYVASLYSLIGVPHRGSSPLPRSMGTISDSGQRCVPNPAPGHQRTARAIRVTT